MNLLRLAPSIAVLGLLLLSASPRAALITVEFEGVLGDPFEDVTGTFVEGDMLVGSYTYETAAPPCCDEAVSYVNPITNLFYAVSGVSGSGAPGGGEISITTSQSYRLTVDDPPLTTGLLPGGFFPIGFFITFNSQGGASSIPNNLLSANPPDIDDPAFINAPAFALQFSDGLNTFFVSGILTKLDPTVIPIPAPALLLVSAVGVLTLGFRRKRTPTRRSHAVVEVGSPRA